MTYSKTDRANVLVAACDIVASWVRQSPLEGVTMAAREARTTFRAAKLWLVETILPACESYTAPVALATGPAMLEMTTSGGLWTATLYRGSQRLNKPVTHRYPLSAAHNAILLARK